MHHKYLYLYVNKTGKHHKNPTCILGFNKFVVGVVNHKVNLSLTQLPEQVIKWPNKQQHA